MSQLSTSQAAKHAGVNDYTIIQWCKAGHIKHVRHGLGKEYVIYSGSLDEYLAKRKKAPAGHVAIQTAAGYYDNLSVHTIRRMIADGRLTPLRVGSRVYVNKAEVDMVAETYDADKARSDNGKRSASLRKTKPSKPAGNNAMQRAIENRMPAQEALLESIRAMGQVME